MTCAVGAMGGGVFVGSASPKYQIRRKSAWYYSTTDSDHVSPASVEHNVGSDSRNAGAHILDRANYPRTLLGCDGHLHLELACSSARTAYNSRSRTSARTVDGAVRQAEVGG